MGPTLRERGRAINSTEDASPERAARRGGQGAARPRTLRNGPFVTSQPQPSTSIALVLPSHFAAFEKKNPSDPRVLPHPRGCGRGQRVPGVLGR